MKVKNLANIEDYLKWRGDITFKQSPLNEVDNLILSELSYIEIIKPKRSRKVTVKEAITNFLKKYDEKELIKKFSLSENPTNFFKNLALSKRFGNLVISKYVNKISKKEEKQFSAMIIHISYNTVYIAFKGTDETILGWKEDLNMSYMDEIPSQQEAVNYVNRTVKFKHRHIYLGGHSKGGNLAVYAGVKCKKNLKRRIISIYNNDGPGFLENFTTTSNYQFMLPKIITILPETSIIGMLLTHTKEYKVVKSNSIGIWQHDILTWQVEGTFFVPLKTVSETSNKIQKTITDWLKKIDSQKRKVFINALYNILISNNINTVEELANLKIRAIPSLFKTLAKLDTETYKIVVDTLKELMKEANKNFDRKTLLHSLKLLNRKRIQSLSSK